MSYSNQPQPASRRPGLNPMLLIVVGLVVFWFLNNNRSPNAPDGNGNDLPQSIEQIPREKRSSGGDWKLDEMDAVQSRQPRSDDFDKTTEASKNSRNSPWSMEEMDLNKEDGDQQSANPKSNKTENGDWAMEEVDKK